MLVRTHTNTSALNHSCTPATSTHTHTHTNSEGCPRQWFNTNTCLWPNNHYIAYLGYFTHTRTLCHTTKLFSTLTDTHTERRCCCTYNRAHTFKQCNNKNALQRSELHLFLVCVWRARWTCLEHFFLSSDCYADKTSPDYRQIYSHSDSLNTKQPDFCEFVVIHLNIIYRAWWWCTGLLSDDDVSNWLLQRCIHKTLAIQAKTRRGVVSPKSSKHGRTTTQHEKESGAAKWGEGSPLNTVRLSLKLKKIIIFQKFAVQKSLVRENANERRTDAKRSE